MMPPEGGPQSHDSNRRRWIIVGVSFAAVVALVVGLLVWQSGSGDGPGTPAVDDGVDRTVGLLTEKDPVCDDWIRYADELGNRTQSWSEAEESVPATKWTPEQRDVFESAAQAMTTAADRFEALLPNARHVVIQELVAQTVVYLRSYVERVPNYVAADSLISGAAFNFMNAVAHMCSTASSVSDFAVNTRSTAADARTALKPFVREAGPTCAQFVDVSERQNRSFTGWMRTDSTVPATEWTAEQRRLFNAIQTALRSDLEKFREMESQAGTSIFADLIWVHNAYMQAFADAIPTYTPPDSQLWTIVTSLAGGIMAACEANL